MMTYCDVTDLIHNAELLEKLARRERSFRFDHAIQKPRLFEKIDGFGLIVGRATQYTHTDIRQRIDRTVQVSRAIAEIRAERKID